MSRSLCKRVHAGTDGRHGASKNCLAISGGYTRSPWDIVNQKSMNHQYEWAELVDTQADETMNVEICECGHHKGDINQPHKIKTYEKNTWLAAYEAKRKELGILSKHRV